MNHDTQLTFYVYNPHYNIEEIPKTPLLPVLLYHDPSKDTASSKRSDITVENLNRIISSLPEDSVLGVLSGVIVRDREFHLPIMDFACRESPENLAKIEQFLRILGHNKGVILTSGRSYHYYGVGLMSEEQWLSFLGDCGLSGLADPRYIFHRLKDICGILRLSACPLRPKIPKVVSIL